MSDLNKLNNNAISLLSLVTTILPESSKKEEIIKEFKKNMRMTKILEELEDRYVIAISGMQGAGKSALIKKLYDIPPESYLPENLERGEKLPILITEKENINKCEGVKYLLKKVYQEWKTEKIPINEDEFYQISRYPSEYDLMLELMVPAKYNLSDEISFILLPGFEINKKQEEFQQLLEIALYGSATCVFVIDPSRYMTRENREVPQKIMEYFGSAKPLFVFSKTDQEGVKAEEARLDFIKEFKFGEDDADRVICTGIFNEDDKNYKWIDSFISKINKYKGTRREFKGYQLSKKEEVLVNFGLCIEKIKTFINDLRIDNHFEKNDISRLLSIFDNSVLNVRNKYEYYLNRFTNFRKNASTEEIKTLFKNRDLLAKIGNFIFKIYNHPKERMEFEKRILDIWNNSCEYSTQDEIIFILNKALTAQGMIYEGINLSASNKLTGKELRKYSLQDFVVNDKQHSFVESQDFRDDLAFLFTYTRDIQPGRNNTLLTSLKYIPVLVLEYLRINSIIPINENVTFEDKNSFHEFAEKIETDFSFLKTKRGKIISAIGVILGVDGAVDGKIDTIPNLIKALGMSPIPGDVIPYITAVLSAGLIVLSIINLINKSQMDDYNIANEMVNNIADDIKLRSMNEFDNYMSFWKELLSERLADRFHLNENQSRIIRLDNALNDFDNIRKNILERISNNPLYAAV